MRDSLGLKIAGPLLLLMLAAIVKVNIDRPSTTVFVNERTTTIEISTNPSEISISDSGSGGSSVEVNATKNPFTAVSENGVALASDSKLESSLLVSNEDESYRVTTTDNSYPTLTNDNSVFEHWLESTFSESNDKSSDFELKLSKTDDRASSGSPVVADDIQPDLRLDDIGGSLEIAGRILASNNKPVLGQLITASRRIGGRIMMRSALTDRSGVFSIDGLSIGDYIVRIEGSETYAGTSKIIRAGSRSITLHIANKQKMLIGGLITDEFGSPIIGATVQLVNGDDARFKTDESGYFQSEIAAITSHSILLRYEADGYLIETRQFDTQKWVDTEVFDVGAQLRSAGILTLTGSVRDPYGQPISRAAIQISSKKRNFRLKAISSEDGEFMLSNVLVSDDLKINVEANKYYRQFTANNVNLDRDLMNFDIVLQRAELGQLVARVEDSFGSPIPQLGFVAISSGDDAQVTALSSTNEGQLILRDFLAGGVTLRSSTSPNIVIKGLRLKSSEIVSTTIKVDMGSFTLRGRVTNAHGQPIRNAKVNMAFTSVDGNVRAKTSRSERSDSSGYFHFTGLGEGKRSIQVEADNYTGKTLIADPAVDRQDLLVLLNS